MEIPSPPGPFCGVSQKGPGDEARDEANVEKEPGLETKRPRAFSWCTAIAFLLPCHQYILQHKSIDNLH